MEEERTAEQGATTVQEENPSGGFLVVLVLLFVGFGWLAYRLYPAHHVQKRDPSFIDSIFANNLVLFAARLVLASAAVVLAVTAIYVIWSMFKGMTAGQMLTKFGPLEMQETEDLSADVEMWQTLWSEATDENEQLRERLAATDADLQQLYAAFRATTGQDPPEEEQDEPPPTS
jgi:hypothetical protein